jgi:hypothetical protein
MSDRDRDLTGLFVRDIDRIDLPPRGAWRPAPRKEHWTMSVFRPLAYATATGLVLVAALVVGITLRDRGAPAASPSPIASATATPSATATSDASTASPAATTAPAASPTESPRAEVLDERFGFYFFKGMTGQEGVAKAAVRSETSDAEIASFDAGLRSFISSARSVSPDGRFIAYWGPVREGAVLHVRAATGGSARDVFTAAPEMSGGNFAWSADGTGIVVALDNDRFLPTGGPPKSEFWTVDLASGATEMIANAGGSVWIPLTWDRRANVVVAGVTGEGGFVGEIQVFSLAAKPYAVRSVPLRDPGAEYLALSLGSSHDARFASAMNFVNKDIVWWPAPEPEKRSTIPAEALAAKWRPGTSEIWWVDGLTGSGCPSQPCRGTELISFDVMTGVRTVRARGDFGTHLVGFRMDGSAAITARYGSAEGAPATWLSFVDFATGRTADVTMTGSFVEPVRLR